jgi:hypothetical protein
MAEGTKMVEYLKLAGSMIVLLLLAPIWLGISFWLRFQEKRDIRKYRRNLADGAGVEVGRDPRRALIEPGAGTEAAASVPRIAAVGFAERTAIMLVDTSPQ